MNFKYFAIVLFPFHEIVNGLESPKNAKQFQTLSLFVFY